MNIANCSVEASVYRWRTWALGVELTTCVLGAVGCVIGFCCLRACEKIKVGMKIQISLIFTVSFIVCTVALPGYAIADYWTICWQIKGTSVLAFLIFYSVSVNIVRNYFTVLAIYRFLAVCFPIRYQQFSQRRVVTGIVVTVTVCIVLAWSTLYIIQDYSNVDVNNRSSYYLGRILFYFSLVIPFTVTVIAYFALALFVIYRKLFITQPQGIHRRDQIAESVSILILMNLLLDVPHITVHLSDTSSNDVSYIIVHMVYHLRFVFDSFLFVCLNKRYRLMVLRYVSSKLLRRELADITFSDTPSVPSAGSVGPVR
ncbi:G-protein coupled receptor 183 [Penaeus vannamei]|uniref:G-protein coupled receptor 183 n=1 Tax=Penaeus vannamei TaxID=6689 RepID=UPI00387F5278